LYTISVFKEFNNTLSVFLVQLINFISGIGKQRKSTERKRRGKYEAMKDAEKKKAEK